ncbi:MAG: NUDIX domain-containing protein [Alphaproteobacteria bacterium]|nr:MAG: NUDIX domain-containing protein [Alphaproteobacteria bacterium]
MSFMNLQARLMKTAPAAMRRQVAALCHRQTDTGREVLLITTRGTGRWMLPKGWPMAGKPDHEAARIEAWEEAGVRPARVAEKPFGAFDYVKNHDDGTSERCLADAYPIEVETLAEDFPEAGQRRRQWVPVGKAADMAEDRGLRDLLRAFAASTTANA